MLGYSQTPQPQPIMGFQDWRITIGWDRQSNLGDPNPSENSLKLARSVSVPEKWDAEWVGIEKGIIG